MNRKTFIIAMLIPMIAILAFIGYNYYTYSTGKEILLKTVPVDPWDLFRGDYVNLRYEISTIDIAHIPYNGNIDSEEVYAVLSRGEKFWSVASVGDYKPALRNNDEVCIKGKITDFRNKQLIIEYGIESYFVPEGKGKDIEREIRNNVSVMVSVDSNCRAIIKELYINDKPVQFGK